MNSQPLQHGKKSMTTSLSEILMLRSQWEDEVARYRFPEKELYHGTINSLEWFLENGHSSNRLRKNYNTVVQLTEEILEKI